MQKYIRGTIMHSRAKQTEEEEKNRSYFSKLEKTKQ